MIYPDLLEATEPVARAFEKLGIRYFIGGSIASSAYGIARSTMDVDIISNLAVMHVSSLVGILESSYYIDENMILDAIKEGSCFNIIHLSTMLKIDIFISSNSAYDMKAFSRRREDTLDEDNDTIKFYLASPEDIIISKLVWYRLGREVYERQWTDLLGVMKVQKNCLDIKYLYHWASDQRVLDLLEKAFDDAGFDSVSGDWIES